jgi:hypothetical protein
MVSRHTDYGLGQVTGHTMADMETRTEFVALRIFVQYVAAFIGAFALSAAANWVAWHFVGHFSLWIDDVLVGVAAILLFAAYRRHEEVRREVNHHVRNSLQIILYSDDEQAIDEARRRIDQALRTWL